MDVREASCRCGGLRARCSGEPFRISVCHCLACKVRTGTAFSYNATYNSDQVERIGDSALFTRTGDEGHWVRYHFCPGCGSTLFYEIERRPGMVSVPVGGFSDPNFPEPRFSVYEERRHHWVELRTQEPIERD